MLIKANHCSDKVPHLVDSKSQPSRPQKMQIRVKLYILSFAGFMVNYMLRTDLNIAILAMARQDVPNNTVTSTSFSMTPRNLSDYNGTIAINSTLQVSPSTQPPICTNPPIPQEPAEFNWTNLEQNNLQTGFYLSYFISSGISGIFVNRLGPTKTFGYGQFVCGLGSLLIPVLASENSIYVLILRSIQGFAEGVTWPAFYAIVGRWIPPFERNRFLSATYGYFMGIGLSYIVLGYVISFFGWRSVFYLTGTLNTIWCICWLWNVYDDPEDHPTITEAELKLIQSKRQNIAPKDEVLPTPWKDILLSPIFWSISISNFGRFWIMSVIFLYTPLYLKNIVQIQIDKNGVYSGIPYIIACAFSLPVSCLADYMIKERYMTTVAVRLLFTMLCQVGTGLLLLLVVYTTNAFEFSILCTAVLILFSFSSSGSAASIVDIAPNFAGPTLAVGQLIFMSANFICPVLVNFMIVDVTNPKQWLHLFQISTAIGILTFIPYCFYVTDKVQYWNDKKSAQTSKSDSQSKADMNV